MRGRNDSQTTMLSLVAPEQRVPQAHPLRRIKQLADSNRPGMVVLTNQSRCVRRRYARS